MLQLWKMTCCRLRNGKNGLVAKNLWGPKMYLCALVTEHQIIEEKLLDKQTDVYHNRMTSHTWLYTLWYT